MDTKAIRIHLSTLPWLKQLDILVQLQHILSSGNLVATSGLTSAFSGDIVSPGMVTPLPKDIYSPILEELKLLGIKAKRTITTR